MSANPRALVPELQPYCLALVDAAGAAGLLPQLTSTLRTHSEQRRLYNRFLAGQSEFPVLPPGLSAHEYGWAFDLIVTPFESLGLVGATWRDWGGVWGSTRDPVHFELPGASEAAKQQALTPGSEENSYLADAINMAVGFLPGIGGITTAAFFAKYIPGLSPEDVQALSNISSPIYRPAVPPTIWQSILAEFGL